VDWRKVCAKSPHLGRPIAKPFFSTVFSTSLFRKLFDRTVFLLYTLCFVRGIFPKQCGHLLVRGGWLEGNSSVPEQDRRNGTEERPEWGASPEKPSKPLRFGTKSGTIASWSACGVSCWYLRSRRKPFSTFVCSRAFLCAPREPRQFVCAQCAVTSLRSQFSRYTEGKRGILCRRFRNLYAWVEKGS
jgi:hypothetical protein